MRNYANRFLPSASHNFYICRVDYLELDCAVTPADEFNEILIAYLSAISFTIFEETCAVPAELFKKDQPDALPVFHESFAVRFDYSISTYQHTTWNEEWEKNHSPVIIAGKVPVCASHHEKYSKHRYELVINPGWHLEQVIIQQLNY